jgi:hypothetical protein
MPFQRGGLISIYLDADPSWLQATQTPVVPDACQIAARRWWTFEEREATHAGLALYLLPGLTPAPILEGVRACGPGRQEKRGNEIR